MVGGVCMRLRKFEQSPVPTLPHSSVQKWGGVFLEAYKKILATLQGARKTIHVSFVLRQFLSSFLIANNMPKGGRSKEETNLVFCVHVCVCVCTPGYKYALAFAF